jgi:hypothetical protein
MRHRAVKTAGVQSCGGRKAFILAILFSLQFNVLHTSAQDSKTLSEKPLITQIFEPAKNETVVKVLLGSKMFSRDPVKIPFGKDKSNPLRIYAPSEADTGPPVQSGLLLSDASYIYEGRTPAGKQSVRFTFYSKRKDTFKDQSAFSISIEGQTIAEGVAEPPVQLASDEDFGQRITVSVSTDVFLRIARAKKVQFKLGPKAYKPEGFQYKSMRALADIIDPQNK